MMCQFHTKIYIVRPISSVVNTSRVRYHTNSGYDMYDTSLLSFQILKMNGTLFILHVSMMNCHYIYKKKLFLNTDDFGVLNYLKEFTNNNDYCLQTPVDGFEIRNISLELNILHVALYNFLTSVFVVCCINFT